MIILKDIIEIIKKRRSVRNYKEDPVSDEDIEFLIDCARYAPLLVIIFGNKKSLTADWDCAMAAQNMMLAAHSRGIGSCWIGLAMPALMDETILEELGAPPGYKAVAPLIFGYPHGKTATAIPERREPEVKLLR